MTTCLFSTNEKCTEKCKWIIKSSKYKNCFWIYVRDKSDSHGVMSPNSQTEIASLLDIKSAKISTDIQKAHDQLTLLLIEACAKEWLKETTILGFESLPRLKGAYRRNNS